MNVNRTETLSKIIETLKILLHCQILILNMPWTDISNVIVLKRMQKKKGVTDDYENTEIRILGSQNEE